jgi:alpha-maltose-1-phosphate synthase
MVPKTPAFFYHPDGFETSRPNLMGRHAAGEEFLKAVCRHTSDETLYCYAPAKKHFEHFVQKTKTYSTTNRKLAWIPWANWVALSQPGSIYMPGPVLHDLAWQRRFVNQRMFSIVGVTHTTATSRVMDALGELITAPLQPWDALICTSHCVRQTVRRVASDQFEFLKDRFGKDIKPPASIQLPVIPLGVDCGSYAVSEDKHFEYRTKWRDKFKSTEEEFVILFFGRLSFHAKAHPVPMYMAAEAAARQSKRKFHLVLAGWFQNDKVRDEFISAAKALCPSMRVSFVDGRIPEVRREIWHMADIFSSLVDNIQETFGLTPVEAMASGLPVVISDWNGYRETVTDGVEGFLIPTWMSPPGFGEDLAMAHAIGIATYDHYVGYQSQFTSVDVGACTAAYLKLAEDGELRRAMSEAGKNKAKQSFDWSVILPQYQQLWQELSELRKTAQESAPREPGQPAHPLRNDPNIIFASYPTGTLAPDTVVAANEFTTVQRFNTVASIPMSNYAKPFLYSKEDTLKLIDKLSQESHTTMQSLCSEVDVRQGRALLFTLLWLSKMGMVELTAAGNLPGEVDYHLSANRIAIEA